MRILKLIAIGCIFIFQSTHIAAQSHTDTIVQFAYIKNFYKKKDTLPWQIIKPLQMNLKQPNTFYTLDADYVQMLTGEEAVVAAQKRGEADSTFDDDGNLIEVAVPNDYYIVNENPLIRRLPVSLSVRLDMLVEQIPPSAPKIPVTPLQRLHKMYRHALFELTLVGETVVKIKEVYLP